jgi:glycosyltransferase involved in cell wall biosynthesis
MSGARAAVEAVGNDEASDTEGGLPRLSIIIPCRNEARSIGACLDSVVVGDYPRDRIEVLVIDGLSEDGTPGIVAAYAERYPWIRLVPNPARVTPVALNIGIREAAGDVIMRMDAHAAYPPDYASRLVAELLSSGADNVGGVCETVPAKPGIIPEAIALALAHPFGVGNSYFRVGADAPRYVDTVPFGCYRRDTFARIGLFDETLERNQDDELNNRLLRAGGSILLVPDVVIRYQARSGLRQLWRMFWQYGYYKPLVIRRTGAVMTARQLVPGAFAGALAGSAAAAVFSPSAAILLAAILGVYAAAVLAASATRWRAGITRAAALSLTFPTMHLAYGFGFLAGAAALLAGRWKRTMRASR